MSLPIGKVVRVVNTKMYLEVGLGRISGGIPDIENIRPDIQYYWIFSLTLLKLYGRISDKLVFSITKIYIIRPGIRPNRISGPTLVKTYYESTN